MTASMHVPRLPEQAQEFIRRSNDIVTPANRAIEPAYVLMGVWTLEASRSHANLLEAQRQPDLPYDSARLVGHFQQGEIYRKEIVSVGVGLGIGIEIQPNDTLTDPDLDPSRILQPGEVAYASVRADERIEWRAIQLHDEYETRSRLVGLLTLLNYN